MEKLDKAIKSVRDRLEQNELSNVDFLDDRGIQKSILRNLIELKHLLKKIIYEKGSV